MENLSQNQSPSDKDFLNKPAKAKSGYFFIVWVVLVSIIVGGLSGAAGAFYLLKEPFGQKLLGKNFVALLEQKVSISESSAIIDVVKKSSPAVVSIVVSEDLNKIPGYGMTPFGSGSFDFFFGGNQSNQNSQPNVQQVAAGSGFFVSADGLIITNKHVVSTKNASYTVITNDGKTYEAKVLAQDPGQDIALVKIEIKNAPFLVFADSSKLQAGQQVVAIGNSLGEYQNTVTSGIISGIGRKITAGGQNGNEDLSGVIQTDAAINPGNSGGPLLDITGNVIGINTAIDEHGQLVGFAISSNDASRALLSYLKNGKITRSFLGIRYITLTEAIAKEQKLNFYYGALIVRGDTVTDFAVQPGSPADQAGLVENDIILEASGQKVSDKNTLADILKNFNPGQSISLKISHKGSEKTISVVLGESK